MYRLKDLTERKWMVMREVMSVHCFEVITDCLVVNVSQRFPLPVHFLERATSQ